MCVRPGATWHHLAVERRKREFGRKRVALEAQMAALRAELEAGEEAIQKLTARERDREERLLADRKEMDRSRKANGREQEARGNSKPGARR